MEEKQVYISFDKQEYRNTKARLLECQINLVSLQKKASHLKAVRSNKRRYLSQLRKSFSSTRLILSRLESKMPEAGLPKHLKVKMPHKEKVHKLREDKKIKEKKHEEIVSDLDRELMDIQERLNRLNSK